METAAAVRVEIWFHVIEIAVNFLVVGLPILWGVLRLASIMRDFPPHRHIGRRILYPKGYNPYENGSSRTDGD